MGIFDGKGMSVNVNLSVEQMEAIASLTADKVNVTKNHYTKELEWMQSELETLRSQLRERDKLITINALSHERYKDALRKRNATVKELREELEALKSNQ